jgi:DNA repair exonuclease SbcCD ATPase subunit
MALPKKNRTAIPDVGGAVRADPTDGNMTVIPAVLANQMQRNAAAAAAANAADPADGGGGSRVNARETFKQIREAERWEKLEKERLRRQEEERKAKAEQEAVRKQLEEEDKERKRKEEEEALSKIDRARVWIAAETEAIYDWQRHKMIIPIPVNQPCRGYLERLLCEKMKWNDINGFSFYKALGSHADTVEPSDEVLQTMLTPQQLRMTTTGMNFVMVRKSKKTDEERLVPAYEYFLTKAEKFLELYDPHKRDLAPQMLREFVGNEQDLIDAFLRRYGPEPTKEQIAEKRAFLKRQRELAEAAAERARQAGLTNSIRTLSEREKANVMRILEKLVFTRTLRVFYRKWQAAVRKHRLNKLICELSNAHLEKLRRKEYFGKLKLFAESKKNKRQLATSSQIAIRNESLLGDLASENMGLKNEIRKLHAHIEVLENASNKRLETLYSGSEAAVHELKRLTAELRYKAASIFSLEKKVHEATDRVAKAEAQRDEAVAQCADRIRDFSAMDANYRAEERAIDAQIDQLHTKITTVSGDVKGAGHTCKHCPHYHGLVAQGTINKSAMDTLRNRIENAEANRRGLTEAIEKLKEKLAQNQQQENMAPGAGGGGRGAKSVSFDEQQQQGKTGPSLPQVLIDLDDRRRRLAAGELEHEIPLTPALLALLSPEEQDKYRKVQEDLVKPKSMMDLLLDKKKDTESSLHASQSKMAEIEKNSKGGDRATSAGADSTASGGVVSSTGGSSGGAGGAHTGGSILGPVSRADLSMARYFNGEVERTRDRVRSALEKRWELKPKTPLGAALEEQRQREAEEEAKRARYALTRRDAYAQGIFVATRTSAQAGDMGNADSSKSAPQKK